jgi:DNA polymerase-3 subunit gamma/tau
MSPTPATSEESSDGTYQVLARRYRSRGFDEVVGQESIATTLQNAIERNRTAHAYLFCGTRGVGKTSMARIFAKALNATDDLGEQDAIARAILRGEDMDVIEIDAASNNGVAEARELISNAGLMPARSRWKIYIIDEVHMLSTSAFNALLKTMEEPPPHVKFILCTTDPHKVLPTIQSRCQRFDFRPIAAPRIADHMKAVLVSEGIEADDDVVVRLARLANGSMRDGLSLLDRLIASADGKLDAALLESSLGLVPVERIDEMIGAIAANDAGEVVRASKRLLDEGLSIEQTLDALAERFRTLLAARVCGADEDVLGLGPDAAKASVEQASMFEPASLVHLIALCDAIASKTRYSGAARAVFDAGMVRMALTEHFASAAGLLNGTPSTTPTTKKKTTFVEPPRVAPPTTKAIEPNAIEPNEIEPNAIEPKAIEPKAIEPKAIEPNSASVGTPWECLLGAIQGPLDRAMLDTLQFEALSDTTLTVRVRPGSAAAAAWVRARPESLEALAQRAFGKRISIELLAETAAPEPTPIEVDDVIRMHPVVQEAMDLFDATLVDARPPPEES